jgi:hypothetical protein
MKLAGRSARCPLLLLAIVAGCGQEVHLALPAPDAGSEPQCVSGDGTIRDAYPCVCDSDCESGASCWTEAESGVPGGLCLRLCDPAGDDCAAGYVCSVADGQTVGTCEQTCAQSSDCPPYRACNPSGICQPLCSADGDCLSGVCDTYNATCVATQTEPTGTGIWAKCTFDGDCRSGYCSPVADRCQTPCQISRSACPESGVCATDFPGPDVGICLPRCKSDGSCADPQLECSAVSPAPAMACEFGSLGTCLGTMAPNTDGLNCNCAADCAAGSTCVTEQSGHDPKGFCLQACTASGGECQTGSVCYLSTDGQSGDCIAACAADADCPQGSLCSAPTGGCLPLCVADTDCLGGHCDPYTGRCQATAASGLEDGQSCQSGSQCRSGTCITPGFCSGLCDVARPGCPSGAACVPGGSGDDFGICVLPCASDADCIVTGTTCHLGDGGPSGGCY